MQRRNFLYLSASLLLPAIARASDGPGHGVVAGRAAIETFGDGMQRVQTGNEHAILRLHKSAFLLAPHTDISFDIDKAGLHVRAAQLMKGAVHSVFDAAQPQECNMITDFATIAIRGTAHYCEVEAAHERTYSCCCYGHVHVQAAHSSANNEAALTQKTSYHDARIITATGEIEASPYQMPLNHYDNSLLRLEACVGRTPPWTPPNGKLNFISPFRI